MPWHSSFLACLGGFVALWNREMTPVDASIAAFPLVMRSGEANRKAPTRGRVEIWRGGGRFSPNLPASGLVVSSDEGRFKAATEYGSLLGGHPWRSFTSVRKDGATTSVLKVVGEIMVAPVFSSMT
jgi:hypothetical protein